MRDYRLYLQDILAAIEHLEAFMGEMDMEDSRAMIKQRVR